MDSKKSYTQYEPATAELVLFDNSDVVATSFYCTQNFDRPGDNTCKQLSASAQ